MLILLTICYWIHLLATIIWLGSLCLSALLSIPAWQRQTIQPNQWLVIQQQLIPFINASMILLWITGLIQMTTDSHYTGFLSIDSQWAWAILLKHIAIFGMMGLTLWVQWQIHPTIRRLQLLSMKYPIQAEQNLGQQYQKEKYILYINLALSLTILLLTAFATAIR